MEMKPNREAFERVRDQVGFCGIWCGSCAVGNGSVGERGAELRELLVAYDAPVCRHRHRVGSLSGGS